MGASSIPCKTPVRDIVRKLNFANSEMTYDDLQLELLAQFDPENLVLEDKDYEESLAYVADKFDMEEEDFSDQYQARALLAEIEARQSEQATT